MKRLCVLGSTGSIGRQTLEVAAAWPEELSIVGLSAGSNKALLLEQIRVFSPKKAHIWSREDALELEQALEGSGTRILWGQEGLLEIAAMEEADMVVTALVGMMGIAPTVAAIDAGKHIALANKETLVTAGHRIMPMARAKDVDILPVDSEHSAIFQCLQGERRRDVRRLWLTASGGPFRNYTKEEMRGVSLAQALAHPNWSMGAKITVDSATMVNKGLEVMEAAHLFGLSVENIEVLVHPQSIVHSMVEMVDGAWMAQLGAPDMKLPIQYALLYPGRRPLEGKALSPADLGRLDFARPDGELFPALPLAYRAAKEGGSLPTVYNAANERAVQLFLEEKIRYLDIAALIEYAMEKHSSQTDPDLATIWEVEKEAHRRVEERRSSLR